MIGYETTEIMIKSVLQKLGKDECMKISVYRIKKLTKRNKFIKNRSVLRGEKERRRYGK